MTFGIQLLALAACRDKNDYDGDGFVEPADCNDNSVEAFPGAEERPYDGVDQDCDGFDLTDWDGDGWDAESEGGADCNDQDPETFPGARDVPYDGRDADCDAWSDDDYDHDGFDSKGHGGDDCEDEDPAIIPLDLDGDGYSPCTGDCDDGDPERNEENEPICGNDIDDDCDGVGDCAMVGTIDVEATELQLAPRRTERVRDVGMAMTVVTGPEGPWLVVSDRDEVFDGEEQLVDTPTFVEFLPGPFPAPTGARPTRIELADSRSRVQVSDDDVKLWAAGDDVLVGATGYPSEGSRALRLRTPRRTGETLADLVELELVAEWEARLGESATAVGDAFAFGAPGVGEGQVNLVPGTLRGTHAFGDAGSVLVGPAHAYTGKAVLGVDDDLDGVADLVIAGTGDSTDRVSAVWVLHDPPRSGESEIEDLAAFTLDTSTDPLWNRAGLTLGSGDLDGDGTPDLVVGAPDFDGQLGSVAVLTHRGGAADARIEDAPVQFFALGDDSLGEALVVADLDADGMTDLILGGPATNANGGGETKPGATFVWYGPLEDQLSHSLTADLYVAGADTGTRTLSGRALSATDLSGDGLPDLTIASPWFERGRVDVLLGGWSAEHGF